MLGLLLGLLLATQQNQVTQNIDISWVYVNNKLVWEAPPKELKKTYVLAENAELIVFYPTGDIAMVSCTLFRDREGGPLSMCRGCGFSIRKGNWMRNPDDSVTIKSRIIYTPALILGKPVPEPEEQRWILRGRSKGKVAAEVQSPGRKYVPLSDLVNLDFLSRTITFYASEQK